MKLDPRILLVVTLAATAVIVLDSSTGLLAPLRVAAGILLAVWMPGTALLLAARPRFIVEPASHVLAVPLSLSLLALVGVIADRSPLGLRPLPLGAGVVVTTIVLLLIAQARYRGSQNRRPFHAILATEKPGSLARVRRALHR